MAPSAAAIGSPPSRAEVDKARAPPIELALRGALGLPGDVGGLRADARSGTPALGRASPVIIVPEMSGFRAETHRAASSRVEKDL